MSESCLQKTARIMRETAVEKGSQSLMTHMPEGGSIIYVGPDEDDVHAVLISSAIQIEQKRQK